MTAVFGPNTPQVLRLLTHITGFSPEEIDRVTEVWKQTSSQTRAEGWAQEFRSTTAEERYRVLLAASVARRTALETAYRVDRPDWAFWAAVWDATLAIAVGERIGGHYDTLIAPLAAVRPSLVRRAGEMARDRRFEGPIFEKGARQ